MLWGIGIYAIASLACAFAPSYGSLLLFRAAQGMAAGVGMAVGRAVIRDRLVGPDAQRLMSAVTMVFSVAPAVAPVVGGWIHVWFGWRAVFGFLALFGVALAAGCSFSATLPYVGSAPAIVLDHWRLSETDFAALFVPIVLGFTIGAWVSGRLAGRWLPHRQVWTGYAVSIAAATGAVLLHALVDSPPRRAQQVSIALISFGIQLSCSLITLRMFDMFPRVRGSVASVQSFVALLLGSSTIGFVAPVLQHSMPWLSIGSVLASLTSLTLWGISTRRR